MWSGFACASLHSGFASFQVYKTGGVVCIVWCVLDVDLFRLLIVRYVVDRSVTGYGEAEED